ncbi:hypothetical protein EZS27_028401 [termite gut metagenome]|uniref:Uncharacterized protein n=1 Tax=termite gut metagenome TaxID=433724 RepID=A0A5J4QM18_9ZZZZ
MPKEKDFPQMIVGIFLKQANLRNKTNSLQKSSAIQKISIILSGVNILIMPNLDVVIIHPYPPEINDF